MTVATIQELALSKGALLSGELLFVFTNNYDTFVVTPRISLESHECGRYSITPSLFYCVGPVLLVKLTFTSESVTA